MSDGSLSQDEIDALLQGTGGGADTGAPATASSISDADKKAFKSLLSGIAGSQASNLSMLIGKTVKIDVSTVDSADADSFIGSLDDEVVEVRLDYTEGVTGTHIYVLTKEAAIKISGLMMGQEDVELNDAALSALGEGLSQITGPVATALGDKVGSTAMTMPAEARLTAKDALSLPQGDFVKVVSRVKIEGEEQFSLVELYDVGIVQSVTGGIEAIPFAGPAPGQAQAGPQRQQPMQGFGGGQQQQPYMQQPFMMNQQPYMQQPMGTIYGQTQPPPNVQSVQFPNLQPQGTPQEYGNIGLLMDVYMEMTVELGRTRKLIKEILGMGEGTIIELDKLAGEPVDILVNHKLIAKGEVVVIDENFGVRVTEIVSPMERMGNIS